MPKLYKDLNLVAPYKVCYSIDQLSSKIFAIPLRVGYNIKHTYPTHHASSPTTRKNFKGTTRTTQ